MKTSGKHHRDRPGAFHPPARHHGGCGFAARHRPHRPLRTGRPKRQAGLRQVIGEISARVQQGESFYEAIYKYPKVFNRLYASMVKAGESGGLLAEILDRLAAFLEASSRLKKKVKSAMTYPVIVICIAFCITTFLIVKVVPVFGEIFDDFRANLPAPTQFLLDLSAFIRGNWYFMIIGAVGTVLRRPFPSEHEARLGIWDPYKLKLPVFGPLIHKICMTRFCAHFRPIDPRRRADPRGHGNRRRHLRQLRRRDGHPESQLRCRERGDHLATSLSREADLPADAGPNGLRRRSKRARSTRCSRRWPTSGTRKSRRSLMRSLH